jgi:hypothetical protein
LAAGTKTLVPADDLVARGSSITDLLGLGSTVSLWLRSLDWEYEMPSDVPIPSDELDCVSWAALMAVSLYSETKVESE